LKNMKICFWGNIGKALAGRTSGGGELQIALLAKALAKDGHEVILLDYDCMEEYQTSDGIRIIPIKGWNDGIRLIRTLTHRLPQLYKGLKDQKADIYYCRIRDFRHIFAYWAAHKLKAKFLLTFVICGCYLMVSSVKLSIHTCYVNQIIFLCSMKDRNRCF
jgi:hypothetical protein